MSELREEMTGIPPLMMGRAIGACMENTIPQRYRLARKSTGELILQGAYFWNDGTSFGHEWRDIPTVYLDEEGNEKP
jgi:hypothetical protein